MIHTAVKSIARTVVPALALGALAIVAFPAASQAQNDPVNGAIGGAAQGNYEGKQAAGPLGGLVGGAVGAGLGAVTGTLNGVAGVTNSAVQPVTPAAPPPSALDTRPPR